MVNNGDIVSVVNSVDDLVLNRVDFKDSPDSIVRVDSSFVSDNTDKLLEADHKVILVITVVKVGFIDVLVSTGLTVDENCAEEESKDKEES